MRVLVTVTDPVTRRLSDVVIDAEPDTPVEQVARAVTGRLRGRDGAGTGPAAVTSLAARRAASDLAATGGAPAPDALYVDDRPLDPAAPLLGSGVVDGAVLGLAAGAPSTREPAGAVEVRVVAGPGAGTVLRTGPGQLTVGADPADALVVDDPALGAGAVVVLVGLDGSVEVRATRADGPARLDGAPLPTEAVAWAPGALLHLGGAAGAVLETRPSAAPDASLHPSPDGAWWDYNRPPRLLPPERQNRFRLPAPPVAPQKSPMPWLTASLPALLGVAMAYAFHAPAYLLMALMSPMMMIGSTVSNRRQGRTGHRRQLAEHRARVEAVEADAARALDTETADRRRGAPDAAELLVTATGPRSRLWERRRHDPDHLLLRLGTADRPGAVEVEDLAQIEHRRHVVRTCPDVPVTVSLREAGVVGVAGRGDLPRTVGRWLVGQVAVLQSPRDVQVYVLTERRAAECWQWAGWLPHLRPAFGQDALALVGADTETLGRRVAELSQLVAERRAAAGASGSAGAAGWVDVVVVLDGARRLRALPGVVSLLRDGPGVGVHLLCLDTDERRLPEECTAVVAEGPDGTLVLRRQREADVTGVRPDLVPAGWFDRVARALSAVRDVSDTDADTTLPTAARLLDVLGLEPPTADAVAARWLLGGRTTEAVVGVSLDGPFALDLVRDGPHGLVAGTTGAGKSEFLQTLVASLAVANRPDAMTFVLVDYKGGAAFKDCVALPHTVGMVTDLDTHLVERALVSLGAELTRREHQLAAAGAKDLEDYVDYASRDPSLPSVPRLLIVIDEFASMARELPDFVTGLVNIAQRGRSLGIHLLLATQRPSGVVSPEIRANTNLRIALRVTDAGESSDVIDAPDAARIAASTPGRAYVRLGHASLLPFQAGRVGGRRPGAAGPGTLRPPFVAPVDWDALGRPAPEPPRRAEGTVADERTDLSVLVAAVRGAGEALGVPAQRSPWLPALPGVVVLPTAAEPGPGPEIAPLPWAVEDLPARQLQRTATLDLTTFGHLFVVGAPRSGRSQALRTIAASAARTAGAGDVHLYGLDCGNGALLPLTRFPHCGAVVQRTQTERAVRLLGRLQAEVLRRQDVLGAGGFADVTEQRAAAAVDERLPHVLVLLDRWEGFTGTLGEYDGGTLTDQVQMLLREGASVGVHLVVTGDRSLLSGRMGALSDDKLVLRLTDRGDYSLGGLNPKKLPEDIPPGRGFRADSAVETHVALLDEDPSGPAQVAALTALAQDVRERDRAVPRARRPFRIDVLPATLTLAQAWELTGDDAGGPLWAMVGVGGDELLAVGPDLEHDSPTFLVAGPARSGRSTVLTVMARSLLRGGSELVVAAPRSSPLRELAGVPGVRAVLTGDDLTEEELAPLLAPDDARVVLVVDDGEILRDCSARQWLRGFVRDAAEHRRGLVLGGDAAEVGGGFSGWQVDVRKNRRGALLSPQGITDGDLVGVRVPRSALSATVTPGRAMVHLGSGELVTVQVPLP